MAKKRKTIIKSISFDPSLLNALDDYCKKFKVERSAFVNEAVENHLLRKTEGEYKDFLIPILEAVLTEVIKSDEVQDSISRKLKEVLSRK